MNASWIFRVATHKAVDIRRKHSRSSHFEADLDRLQTALSNEPDRELGYLLNARVDSLPVVLRRYYELRYRNGLTEREIARALGVCRSSVRWLDRRCRRSVAG